jgi:hypothetical protein
VSLLRRAPAIRHHVRRGGLAGLGFGMLLMPALLWPTQAFADPPETASPTMTLSSVTNTPPVAVDDPGIPCGNLDHFGGSFPVPEDWIGDIEGYPGWFVLFGECGLLANDTDVDGDVLDWEIVTQPAHGEAMYVDPEFFAYNPEADWSTLPGDQPGGNWVSDSFTYRAFDGTAYSDPATMRFWLAPINDPPTFTPGAANVSTNEDTEYEEPWATDISTGPPNESDQSITFEISVDDPALFSVGPTISADGVLSFTPARDATGFAEVTVSAKDDGGLDDQGLGYRNSFVPPDDTSEEVSFGIQIWDVNDPPVAVDDEVSIIEDSGELAIDVTANDTDVDGGGPSVVDVSDPGHGTAQANIGGARYQPDPDFSGTDTFTYTISDVEGGQDTATVTVTVEPANDPPVADDDAATLPEDALATLIPVLVGDTDVDGDDLHVIEVSNGFKGTVTITGTGLAVRYKPLRNANGTDSFTYTIEDAEGFTSTATVEVTISPVNDPPNARDDGSPVPLQVVPGTGAASLNVLLNDSPGPDPDDALSIISVTQPAHGTVSIDGGWTVLYEPIGSHVGLDYFTYTISDDLGLTDTAIVYVMVATDATPPVATAPRVIISAASGATGVKATIAWRATDPQSGISRYQLQRQVDTGGWTTVALPAPTSTRLVQSLPPGHDYRFRVRARNGAGIYGAFATGRVTHL